MDEDVQKECAYQQQNYAQGALMGGSPIDHEKMMRDQRVQSAIYALTEAKRVRADPALMAEVRAWLRDKRDELAGVLDELGG